MSDEIPQSLIRWRATCANCIGFLEMEALHPFVDGLYRLAYDEADLPRLDGFGLPRRRLTTLQPVFAGNEIVPRLACLVGGWVDPASDAWLDLPLGTRLLWFAVSGAMTPFPLQAIGRAKLDIFPASPSHHGFQLGVGNGNGELSILATHLIFNTAGDKSVWESAPSYAIQARRFRIGGDVPFFAIGMCYVEFMEEFVDGLH